MLNVVGNKVERKEKKEKLPVGDGKGRVSSPSGHFQLTHIK